MARRRTVLVAVLVGLVVLGAAGLAVLPEIVRRVGEGQLTTFTGRAVTIQDVDLNLFTGRLAVKGVRLAQRDGKDPALEFERLELRVRLLSLLTSNIRVRELALAQPTLRVTRTGPAEFDFSDILARIPPTDPNAPPSTRAVTIERLTLTRATVLARDRAVTPATEWRIEDLGVEGAQLTTRPKASPGRLDVTLRLNGAPAAVRDGAVSLDPLAFTGRVLVEGFDVASVVPYVPPALPAAPRAGRLSVALDAAFEQGTEALKRLEAAGTVTLEGLEVVQAGRAAPFLTLPRLALRLGRADLVAGVIDVAALELDGLDLRAARDARGTIDLLALAPPQAAGPSPSAGPAPAPPLKLRVADLVLRGARATLRDEAVTPVTTLALTDLDAQVRDVTWPSTGPGTVALALKLNGAPVSVRDGAIVLDPLTFTGRVSVRGFDLATAIPYVPPTLPAAPRAGRLSVALDAAFEQGTEALKRLAAAGTVTLEGLEVVQAGRPAPFLTLPRLALRIGRADLVAGVIDVAALELDGLDLTVNRDAGGNVDLLALAPPPAAGPPPPASPAPAPPLKLRVADLVLRRAKATFRDEAVTPVTALALTDLDARLRDVTWPSARPAAIEVTTTLPGGGRLEIKGTATPSPLDAEISMSLRDAPIEPYAAYIPIGARLAGRFSGDNRSRVRVTTDAITAVSKGTSWIDDLELQVPGEQTSPARVAQMRLDGVDFSWPGHAKAAKVTITKPDIRVERGTDGTINLSKIFEPAPAGATSAAATGASASIVPRPDVAPAAPVAAKQPALPLAVELGQIVVEDGYTRFIDRTTTPAFSQTISRLSVTVDNLSSEPGQRAKLQAQAIVGGDAALELRGEIAPFGDLYADISGELRDFSLPSVNPYAESFINWFLRTGKLGVRVHYRIEKDQLTADNEIIIQNLTVARSAQEADEVKKRIGLPLGLIVALITDSQNGINVKVPLTGPLSQLQAGFGDAIWVAVKNVLVNVLAAPFRAIGRLFKGRDDTVAEPKIEPVTFAAGSSLLAPEMERHVTQVADFLRRAPLIRLALAAVATARDVENLKGQELTARLQKLQRERGLADFSAAVTLDFRERLAGVRLPAKPEEQLALLREREPLPPGRLGELQTRRAEAVRDALVKGEGIPAERLDAAEPASSDDATDGRVEFRIGQ